MNNSRNTNNNRHKPYRHMNCFGYAVNMKDWLLMSDYSDVEYLERYGLKPVEKKDLVLGKKYVAYRYCRGDFHFCKRDAKGHWRHKMGGTKARSISQKEVFGKHWNMYNKYNSKLYLYEVI